MAKVRRRRAAGLIGWWRIIGTEGRTRNIPLRQAPLLNAGDNLSRDGFLRRWEAMPRLKFAELIGGVVFMPSPFSVAHGDRDFGIVTWLGVYAAATPGSVGSANTTWLMGEQDAPQLDTSLRILPECGASLGWQGSSRGTPELAAEVCVSSWSYDLHQKRDLYFVAGVREYLTVLVEEEKVCWHRRVRGAFRDMPPGKDGVFCSAVFPALWLDRIALLEGDMARVLATLGQGLASTEHAAFVVRLARKMGKGRRR